MTIEELIRQAAEANASDIHLICGLTPKYRVAGRLLSMREEVLTRTDCEELARVLAGAEFEQLCEIGELDAAATIQGVRFRINLFRQQNSYSAALRLLSDRIPELRNLGLPPMVEQLTDLQRGIVLVTGETGSGKSTTLAAMIDEINHRQARHIITLEDPIEYIYKPDHSIFNQREIGRDTKSYAAGLRAALREDPDIILIGEMRDLFTVETALTAAETGHLVLTTLHTGSAADSIDRIVGVFPEERQQQIRMQLSMTLRAVLAQQLLPNKEGTSRVCACELMIVNNAIRNLIREGKTPQIANAVATSAREGAITMDNAILKLYREGKIRADTAKLAAHDIDYVERNLNVLK
ncbi:type IV pilus twitching motility protein PilT [Clostridium merdae]|uniref:type IV pilus twitching motility protein PilT n=1 Tax=Clostridium merdae TaxID=1958780 RepID=UPI000A267B26|nr:PilT/PilU family type 4a pilus ATPase [Clostridium merdae]